MTICVAMKDGAGVVIGSDTVYGGPGDIKLRSGPKWFPFGGWQVGISGQPRLATLIRDPHNEPERKGVYDVVNRIRELCIEDKWKLDEAVGEAPYLSVHFLMTNGAAIYHVSGRFNVEVIEEFATVGSGGPIAHGVRYGLLQGTTYGPMRMVRDIIEGCVAICDTCHGEPWVQRIPAL